MQELIAEYLASLSAELRAASRTGEYTGELSYRPVTHKFLQISLKAISPKIALVFEPKTQGGAGRPDWRFYDSASLGVFAYAEAKGLDLRRGLRPAEYLSQVDRYLTLGYPVILTDGIDFIFYFPKKAPEAVSLVAKRSIPLKISSAGAISFERLLRSLFRQPLSRRVTEEKLISDVAIRARELSKDIVELISLSPEEALDAVERDSIMCLRELQGILQQHHDASLNTKEVFGEFVAQVLIFGLYYAYRVACTESDTPAERESKLKNFWMAGAAGGGDLRLRPIRAMVEMLNQQIFSLSRVGVWYGDCLMLLAHTSLGRRGQKEVDYHTLYEKFLTQFSPQSRFDFGAFYTPRPLAQYSLSFVEKLTQVLNPSRNLYQRDSKLIDPCCGTGTFLELLVESALRNGTQPLIAGFEILPAPYVLAHYRLGMIPNVGKLKNNIAVLLTNTLSDTLFGTNLPLGGGLVGQEQSSARRMAKPPLTLVIGNPPSSDSPRKGNLDHFKIIDALLDDFRPPKDKRKGRSNIQKQLRNAFVYFLRWTCAKLEGADPGILAMIVPESLLENPSYNTVRQWLSNFFSDLWVLKVDQDARTGASTQSLFNTLQGRALLVGYRTLSSVRSKSIRFLDISSLSVEKKIEFLTKEARDGIKLDGYFEVEPDNWTLKKSKAVQSRSALYNRGVLLCGDEDVSRIFLRHCSGIKLAPSSMLVHANQHLLKRRTRDLTQLSADVMENLGKWFTGQRKPPSKDKLTSDVVRELENIIRSHKVATRYAYRPFVSMWAYLSEGLLHALRNAPGAGTRDRPEVRGAFATEKSFGFAVAPSPSELGDSLHRFTSFCWATPDNDLASRGNAHIFCPQFPDYGGGKNKLNLDLRVMEALDLSSQKGNEFADTLSFYSYSVLCSTLYLSVFDKQLFRVGHWPRIPIPKDIGLIENVADLGRTLASLENVDLDNGLIKSVAKSDWKEPFDLTKATLNEAEGVVELRGNGGEVCRISGLNSSTVLMKISGYNIVKEWLKYRTWPYYRAQFGQEEHRELLDLLNRIEAQHTVITEVDRLVDVVLTRDSAWI